MNNGSYKCNLYVLVPSAVNCHARFLLLVVGFVVVVVVCVCVVGGGARGRRGGGRGACVRKREREREGRTFV